MVFYYHFLNCQRSSTVELWFCKPVVVGSNPTVGCLSISQIVSSFNYKSYKKLSGRIRTAKRSGKRIFPGRRGNRPHKISFACLCVSRRKSRQQAKQNCGAARGAEPLWKSAAADLGSIRRPWSYTAHVFALLPEDDNGAFFMPKSGVFEVLNCKEVILL